MGMYEELEEAIKLNKQLEEISKGFQAIADVLAKVNWSSVCVQELNLYRKALELMANDYSFNSDGKALILDYLQKAREEE